MCIEKIENVKFKNTQTETQTQTTKTGYKQKAYDNGGYDANNKDASNRALPKFGSIIPLTKKAPKAPEITSQMVPSAFYNYLEEIELNSGLSHHYVFLARLMAFSTLVSRICGIKPDPFSHSWEEHSALYAVIIGSPGTKKTGSLKEGLKPLVNLNKDLLLLDKESLVEYSTLSETLEIQIQNIKQEIKENSQCSKSKEKLMMLCKQKDELEYERLQIICNSFSPEALIKVLSNTNASLLAYRDELSGLINEINSSKGDASKETFLGGWNGDQEFTRETIGRGKDHVKKLSLGLLGGIQPSVIDQLLKPISKGIQDDGFAQRLIYVYPETVIKERVKNYFNEDVEKELNDYFERIADFYLQNKPKDMVLKFTDEAQKVFDNFYDEIIDTSRNVNVSDFYKSFINKYPTLFCRLASIYEFILRAEKGNSFESEFISEDAAQMAYNSCLYFKSNLNRVLSHLTSIDESHAHKVARKIFSKEIVSGMTLRDIKQKGWAFAKDKDQLEQSIKLLQELNWLKLSRIKTGGADRVEININPCIYDYNLNNLVQV